jgi:hypothetical protein
MGTDQHQVARSADLVHWDHLGGDAAKAGLARNAGFRALRGYDDGAT